MIKTAYKTRLLSASLVLTVGILATACGGQEFKGSSVNGKTSQPNGTNLPKNTRAGGDGTAVIVDTAPENPQITPDNPPVDALATPPSPQTQLLITPDSVSWGQLQLFSANDQADFIASPSQGWLAYFVSDYIDTTQFITVLGIFSSLEINGGAL